MARKRKAKNRVKTRTVTKTKYKKSKSGSKGITPMKAGLSGFAYGLSRGYVATKMQPIFSKLPAGQYADEAGMLLISYGVAKGMFGVNKIIPKEFGLAGLMVEMAVIGADVGSGKMTGGFGAVAPTQSNTMRI